MIANIILVLGQSNAMSYGTTGVGYPGGWTAASLGAGYAEAIWNATSGWEQYIPGSTSYGNGSGVPWGPEASIALAKRSQSPQVCTYIFKWAVGGVGLAPNPGGDSWSPYNGNMFNSACADLSTALGQLIGYGITPSLDECYWIGNESDCFDWAKASSVAHDLPAFASALRSRFSAPSMKFVVARTKLTLGSGSTSPAPGLLPYIDIVRSGQEAISCIAHAGWFDCDDLASGGLSPGHYDAGPVVTMGPRAVAKAQSL